MPKISYDVEACAPPTQWVKQSATCDSRNKNSVSYTYEVHMITSTNTHKVLLKKIDNAEQALYIEQEIERHLNIQDEAVRGELR